jgi:hypothetical protein
VASASMVMGCFESETLINLVSFVIAQPRFCF